MTEDISEIAEGIELEGSDVMPDEQPDVDGMPENGPNSGGDSSGVTSRLFATEPNPPLESVEAPWDTTHGGLPRIWRGVGKLTGGDIQNMPAILDVAVGCLELAQQKGVDLGGLFGLDGSSSSSSDGEVDGFVIPEHKRGD